MDLSLPFCLLGLFSFAYRLRAWQKKAQPFESSKMDFGQTVSIIVPCRNEQRNLPTLLTSLMAIDYKNLEIIVVDDSSEDDTFRLATEILQTARNAKVLNAGAKPTSWGGKNWPCWNGAKAASGEILLFTDADTVHGKDSVARSLRFLQEGRHDFVSAVPYHRCERPWEKALGLFFLLPLIATAFRDRPVPSRVFAIGQYLMITKDSYVRLGGHQKVSSSLAEDIDLAVAWLKSGLSYGVYPSADLYGVQMYSNFKAFLVGWKRLLRLGLHRSTVLSFLEVSFVCYLFAFSFFEARFDLWLVFAIGIITLGITQRRYGSFNFLSLFAAPLSIWLFVALTMAALFEKLFKRNIKWHGRSYPTS